MEVLVQITISGNHFMSGHTVCLRSATAGKNSFYCIGFLLRLAAVISAVLHLSVWGLINFRSHLHNIVLNNKRQTCMHFGHLHKNGVLGA